MAASQPSQPDSDSARPFFSIVIAVWNRRKLIRECVESVLTQDFKDFEIIAVDDCSTDDSVRVMEAISDPRFRIVKHEVNQGVCAAHHTGTNASRGRWIGRLDTDWKMLPGALRRMHDLACEVQPDVGVIGGSARTDDGEIWPTHPPDGAFGFAEYLKWAEALQPSDYLAFRRREVFEAVQWPTDLRLEMQFNMRLAHRWKFLIIRDVVAEAYTKCDNSFEAVGSTLRKVRMAPYQAKANEEMLLEFGEEIRRTAPKLHRTLTRTAAMFFFQAGQRGKGLAYTLKSLKLSPTDYQMYALLPLGLIGPGAMLRVRRIGAVRELFRRSAH